MIRLKHVTQVGQGKNNLCGQACLAMLANYHTGTAYTARQIAERSGTYDGSFTTAAELVRIAEQHGLTVKYRRPADMGWWADALQQGVTAIALVRYGELYGTAQDFGHFIVPVAMDAEYVLVHDPLKSDGPTAIRRERFQRAIGTAAAGNTYTHQAWVVEAENVVKRGMGYNVHASYTHDNSWATMLTTWERTNPGALLILDSFNEQKGIDKALEAARHLPQTTIIYRRFINGDNQQNYLSPGAWVNMHKPLAGTRVYCALNNEPHGPPENIAGFHTDTVRAARAAGIRVSVGGFSVGSPDDATIAAHEPLLRWMAANPGWAILDLHEYTRALWTVDFARDAKHPNQWPANVPNTVALWLMGRFRRWFAYCDQRGITRPNVVIGEWGWDRVDAVSPDVYGDTQGLLTCATTWQAWGFGDWEKYAADQLKAAWKAIYAPYPQVLGVCYYQISTEPNNWPTFNAWTARRFMDLTGEGFDTMTTTQPQPQPMQGLPAGAYRLNYPGKALNVRSGPSTGAGIVGQVAHGGAVDVLDDAVTEANGYGWQRVNVPGLGQAYMATVGGAWKFDARNVDAELWVPVKQARDQLTAALSRVGIS